LTAPNASIVAAALHAATRELAPISHEDARLEAEVLMSIALGTDRAHVIAALHESLPDDARASFRALIARRLQREPLAYITGRREFHGIDFAVDSSVLIPRPETEMLVEFALDEIQRRGSGTSVADVGTGSGAIAVAIALHAPDARGLATDASAASLAVARRNAAAARVGERIEFREADLLSGLPQLDIILANLPDISEHDWQALPPEIRDHEPRAALVGGPKGAEVIERLLVDAPAHLAPGGALAAEIGDEQGSALLAAARSLFPDADCYIELDISGLDRMLVIRTVGG
jgi:release factor glutamine methyltransferase